MNAFQPFPFCFQHRFVEWNNETVNVFGNVLLTSTVHELPNSMKLLKCKTFDAVACTKHMRFEWYVVQSKRLLKNRLL